MLQVLISICEHGQMRPTLAKASLVRQRIIKPPPRHTYLNPPPKAGDLQKFFENCQQRDQFDPLYMTPYFNMPCKNMILDDVVVRATKLARGGFMNECGGSSRLFVGERGIGKSDVLRRATVLLSLLFDDVVPIYVEYQSDTDPIKPSAHILDALRHRGMDVPLDLSLDDTLDLLEKKRLYVSFIADEVDQLFKRHEHDETGLATLRQLSALGSSFMGRVATTLCGSAGVLPLLISGKGISVISQDFPISKYSPNMNGSKFTSLHVSQGPLKDQALLDKVLQHHFGHKLTQNEANLVFFFCGSNLRRICSFASQGSSLCQYAWDLQAERTDKLICALNDQLWKSNFHLFQGFDEIMDNPEVLSNRVAEVNWVTAIQGIPKIKLRQIAASCGSESDLDTKFGLEAIQHLVDKCWFSAPSTLDNLYPATPVALFMSHVFSASHSHYQRAVDVFRSIAVKIGSGRKPFQ